MTPHCRYCNAPLTTIFADLGKTPISNDYLTAAQLTQPEPFYPLRALVCGQCFLVQLEDFVRADDVFRADYAYFSSFSSSWLAHSQRYAHNIATRFGLDDNSFVVELASNDGYLLQYFKGMDIPVLGIEPCKSVAEAAIAKGIPTEMQFFGLEMATKLRAHHRPAQLIVANNVLAHVPNINDFVAGVQVLLADDGVATFEFPHLLNLIHYNQFDTIYHEHYSYLSLLAVQSILQNAGLRVFDVEQLPTHGGSLRVFACHEHAAHTTTQGVQNVQHLEHDAGLNNMITYSQFSQRVANTQQTLVQLLTQLKHSGKTIAGYGAPAKGNTLLNYCGIGRDVVDFTVDRAPSKQGMFLPGSHIPIHAPQAIFDAKPDYVLILPWNLKDEIILEIAAIRDWGGKFIVPIPKAHIVD